MGVHKEFSFGDEGRYVKTTVLDRLLREATSFESGDENYYVPKVQALKAQVRQIWCVIGNDLRLHPHLRLTICRQLLEGSYRGSIGEYLEVLEGSYHLGRSFVLDYLRSFGVREDRADSLAEAAATLISELLTTHQKKNATVELVFHSNTVQSYLNDSIVILNNERIVRLGSLKNRRLTRL